MSFRVRAMMVGLALASVGAPTGIFAQAPAHRNVIIFVADGLRRDAVNAEDMPTFWRIRHEGTDFPNSHSLFPTFTTANASAIATGHYLGDTGDYSNVLYPGVWLAKPDPLAELGLIAPFLENDDVLAEMNSTFNGNYLGEPTLLTTARANGFEVASVGKLGPTAIQQADAIGYDDQGLLTAHGATIVDDSTNVNAGTTTASTGVPLPEDVRAAAIADGLSPDSPTRTNGYPETSQSSNGWSGTSQLAGTLRPNTVQQQWFADMATHVLLPKFAASGKPWVLLFWSRDPDGTQHNEGDSLQTLAPGINGPTVKEALRNVDHDLKQLLDWLDAHPEVKKNTDVLITSDHGFATISRRELDAAGAVTSEPSANLTYAGTHEKPEPPGTLPTGFLAVDLAIRLHMRLYDPALRAAEGASAYQEVQLSGEVAHHPALGNGLLGERVERVDGGDATLLVAANGGSDLIYAPTHDTAAVRRTIAALMQLDYVGGVFAADVYCPKLSDCPGALPMKAIGMEGSSAVPRPAIMVAFKHFYTTPGDLLSGKQISDTTLQEGQGMHGGFARDQTLNNMAAIGPDFRAGYADESPVSNADIVPTAAHLLGLKMATHGELMGRVENEALGAGKSSGKAERRTAISAPTASGERTLLLYQVLDGRSYFDEACVIRKGVPERCE